MAIVAHLADLDELTLLCRAKKARGYIAEAVSCYKAGAYRACIVAAWVAVTFDILDKIRELALTGDKEAESRWQEFEKIRHENDLSRSLAFERELLDLARDKFELLSQVEHVDLERLRDDRNRCAHPSFVSEDEVFQPSAELARTHVRSAVIHLLRHQPVQGKAAMARLWREVDSEYFPTAAEEAIVALSNGPLKRPRDSLVRNFVLTLLKRRLEGESAPRANSRISAALTAVAVMHPVVTSALLTERLSDLISSQPDGNLINVFAVLRCISDGYQHLRQDVCERLARYVQNLPSKEFTEIEEIMAIEPFKVPAERRIRRATAAEINSAYYFPLPLAVSERAMKLYLESNSYQTANSWTQFFEMYASDLTAEQTADVIRGISCNSQLMGSTGLSTVISALRNAVGVEEKAFDAFLEENGLGEYVPVPF